MALREYRLSVSASDSIYGASLLRLCVDRSRASFEYYEILPMDDFLLDIKL